MDEVNPCPYTDEEVSRKLRKWKGHCQIPGLDELILWAADIIDRRPAPENKPLTVEQLRKMDGEPVFSPRCGWGIVGYRKVETDEHGGYDRKYTVGLSYGWEWLDDVMRIGPLYARKPEQERDAP